MATTISSSDGTYLRFETREELREYEADLHEVQMRAYHRQRQRHGVWASNQDKFVASVDQFNQWDQRHMEGRYAPWLAAQPKEGS